GASPEQAVVSRITGRPSARQARREGLMVRFSWDGRGQGSGGGNDRRRSEEPGPGVVIHPDLVRRGRVPPTGDRATVGGRTPAGGRSRARPSPTRSAAGPGRGAVCR